MIRAQVTHFRDRAEAGQLLASRLTRYANRSDVLVLGLPRGGVPVAFEIAGALRAPLDVFVVRKLGVPGHEKLAMGAVATGGIRILEMGVIQAQRISGAVVQAAMTKALEEIARREQLYRRSRPPAEIQGKIVILVDDGLATGSSMRAAVAWLRMQRAARIVIAVPIGAQEVCDEFSNEVDELVCAETPGDFYAISEAYESFAQVTDAEVRLFLDRARETNAA